MNTATKIEREPPSALESAQAFRVLALLDAAGLDLLIETIPSGWRVETERRGNIEGYSCSGSTLLDALAHMAQVLELELELDIENDDDGQDADARIPYALDAPVEFARPLAIDDPEHYRAHVAAELGGTFLQEIAE